MCSSDLEVINGGHSMIVVGSQIDASTQRIMEYLSGTYGVGINAATFQYLQTEGGGELLVRSFAVAPEQVKQNTRSQGGAKRTVPSPEEMEALAVEHGVGDLYRASRQIFAPMFRVGNTKTTSTLQARLQDGALKVALAFVPGKSSAEEGLRYQAYTRRLSEFSGVPETEIAQALPAREPYEYYPEAPNDLKGWAGYFTSEGQLKELFTLLSSSRKKAMVA